MKIRIMYRMRIVVAALVGWSAALAHSSDVESASQSVAAIASRHSAFLASPSGATAARIVLTTKRLLADFQSASHAFGSWSPHLSYPPPDLANAANQVIDAVTGLAHQGKHALATAMIAEHCWNALRIVARVEPHPEAVQNFRDTAIRFVVAMATVVRNMEKELEVPDHKIKQWKSREGNYGDFVDRQLMPLRAISYSGATMAIVANWSPEQWRRYIVEARPRYPHSGVYHAVMEKALHDDIIGFSGTPWYPMGIGEYMDSLTPIIAPLDRMRK